jgi:hypothetical protein
MLWQLTQNQVGGQNISPRIIITKHGYISKTTIIQKMNDNFGETTLIV